MPDSANNGSVHNQNGVMARRTDSVERRRLRPESLGQATTSTSSNNCVPEDDGWEKVLCRTYQKSLCFFIGGLFSFSFFFNL